MKFLKYAGLAMGLFLITAVGFFFYSVYKLPDPVAIKQKLKNEEPPVFEPQNEIQEEVAQEIETLADSISEDPIEETETKERERQDLAIRELINEEYEDIRICENLGKNSAQEINFETLKKAIDSSDREDPVVEAVRVPLKYIFQSKPVKELFEEIEAVDEGKDLNGKERTSYLEKIGFYATAANKVREMYSQKAEYEEVGDRGYHLYVITQLVNKKPELAHDKNLMNFCNQLEGSVATKSKTDIDEERKELLKLIDYSGLQPKDLNFNPEIRTKFHVNLDKKGISFGFEYPGKNIQ